MPFLLLAAHLRARREEKGWRILKEEMENVVHYSVPLTTEVGTGKTWLSAH